MSSHKDSPAYQMLVNFYTEQNDATGAAHGVSVTRGDHGGGMSDTIMCGVCREDETPLRQTHIPARYALSLSESNSGANMNFVCADCLKPQLDVMLDLKMGSVDVQAMWIPIGARGYNGLVGYEPNNQ